MKKSFLAGCIAIVLFTFAGCKTQKAMTSLFVLEGEWSLTELKGDEVTSELNKQFIVFDTKEKHYTGNAGCNRMSGWFEYNKSEPNRLRISQPVTTRMACPQLDAEYKFVSALEEVVRFEVISGQESGKQIAFYDKNDTRILVFQKK